MPESRWLKLEATIARAHRQVYWAEKLSYDNELPALAEALGDMRKDLEKAQVDLLRGHWGVRKFKRTSA